MTKATLKKQLDKHEINYDGQSEINGLHKFSKMVQDVPSTSHLYLRTFRCDGTLQSAITSAINFFFWVWFLK